MQNTVQSTSRRTSGFLCKALAIALLGFVAAPDRLNAAAEQPVGKPPLTGVSPSCEPFSGRFVITFFTFTGPTTAEATAEVWLDGVVIGTAHALYDSIVQRGDGTLQMNGHHTITYNASAPLGEGVIVTSDEIRLMVDKKNPAWARANSRLYIVEGTGAYEGATGLLHTHGDVNLFTYEGGIDFKGQICIP